MLDIYFQPEYGKLYEQIEGGVCEAFEYKYDAGTIRNMYIKRPVPWLIDGIQYYDVITPYGYGGPVIIDGNASSGLLAGYYAAWSAYCHENGIVAEFIRFHLFDNTDLRNTFPGEIVHISDNVVRRLDDTMDVMWMEFEHKVRKNVKKAQSNGLTVTIDGTGTELSEFLNIYYSTMERNNAKDYYYFNRAYFQSIINTLPGRFMFFHVWKDDTIVSTELVLCSDKYVYSFLGGTMDEYYSMRPNDLLKYEIIKWGKETRHIAFILGGGYGGNDGIYRYKKAFAPGDDVPFYIGRLIHNKYIYDALVEKRKLDGPINEGFFPQYRG